MIWPHRGAGAGARALRDAAPGGSIEASMIGIGDGRDEWRPSAERESVVEGFGEASERPAGVIF
jgi:hypothetical protein